MKNLILLVILVAGVIVCMPGYAGLSESHYQGIDCSKVGGVAEYRNVDKTRTDCYTREVSIEHDFAKKWYECITQAMHYAMLNSNAAVCRLIVVSDRDKVLFDRAIKLRDYYKLPVVIQSID